MSTCKLWIVTMLLVTCNMVFAQTIEVTGKVTAGKTNEEVIGVVVLDKNNPNNGTITDLDGRFNLRVDRNATLTVSSVGYRTTDVQVNGQSFLTIHLEEEVFDLETVVVVGVAMKKKRPDRCRREYFQ
ncbi:MAG: carboxypeptidase-like regulatory domain-containing protein [Tannerellaceae bacterium]|nr:carboxypeptidase-like regulatory domain-containing protein [Tannerellaceae bacterium]